MNASTACQLLLFCTTLCFATLKASFPVEENQSSTGRSVAGKPIADHVRVGENEQSLSLDDYSSTHLLVVAFLGTECPLAKLYAARLAQLARVYRGEEVQFLGICSNQQDSVRDIAEYSKLHQIPFPVLKDHGSQVADQLGAERTPEVFVLDKNGRVRYRGRIDDQYAIGVKRETPNREDLSIAIMELLAGDAVSIPETEAIGCLIGRDPIENASNETNQETTVTFHQDVITILRERCVSCHQAGQAAPFALVDYEEVVGWSAMIREVVEERRMPPWFASPDHGEFVNDARLTDHEKKTLIDWIDNGCREGIAPHTTVEPDLDPDWRIRSPDQVLQVQSEPFLVPAEGAMAYQYFLIDPGFTQDRFIKAVEVRPGAPEVVHHALISIADEGHPAQGIGNCGILINYAPGMQPTDLPEGVAIRIPAGSKFIAQMHYTPNGSQQWDQTSIGIVFAESDEVDQLVEGSAIVNTLIEIPPGAGSHEERAILEIGEDIDLLSLSPHMHLRGKSFRIEVVEPNGKVEVLLDVPRYDFNWQLRYVFKQPRYLRRGARLICTATYDNSMQNPANPDPSQTVRWGDQTEDEMLIGFYSFIRR